MIPYIIVGTVLLALVILSLKPENSHWVSAVCFVILLIFTGLRYNLGYDWLAYEKYFEYLDTSISFKNYYLSQNVLIVEYLYFLLNVFVKYIGNFELLLFLISFFNIYIIHHMCNKIDKSSHAFVWFVYFCLALVMAQFNILRQSIASSFVILAILSSIDNKHKSSFVLMAAAIGFHTSTIIFIPLLFLKNLRIKAPIVISALLIVGVIAISGSYLLSSFINVIYPYLPGRISEKAGTYVLSLSGGSGWGISPFAVALTFVYFIVVWLLYKAEERAYTNIVIWLTIYVLVAHIAFSHAPLLWNRIMCVSLPWQMAVLWKVFVTRRLGETQRWVGLASGGAVALAAMTYQMSRPESIAFVPYHSLLQVWLFNDEGDGRVRSMYAVQMGQIEQAQMASEQGPR